MNTTEKALIGTAAFAAGSAVGTFFAGRAAWRGINKAKSIGVIVLAIVAYHSFDTYRASVDTAWGKVETVIEQRAEAKTAAAAEAAAERREVLAQTRAAELHEVEKAAIARKAAEARKAEDTRVAAIMAPYEIPASMSNEECRADAKFMLTIVGLRDRGAKLGEVKAAFKETIERTKFADPVTVKRFINALIDVAYEAPIPASLLVPATYQACMEDTNRHKVFTAPVVAKPKPAPKPIAKPAPISSDNWVTEARQQVTKARAVCRELYPQYAAHPQHDGLCSGEANANLRAAKDNLAKALMAN